MIRLMLVVISGAGFLMLAGTVPGLVQNPAPEPTIKEEDTVPPDETSSR